MTFANGKDAYLVRVNKDCTFQTTYLLLPQIRTVEISSIGGVIPLPDIKHSNKSGVRDQLRWSCIALPFSNNGIYFCPPKMLP